ncbi:Prolyl 4-hydroxylase, alpha subunit,Oxoglutarate/iron-dependent dioxygenase,Prolyl 4- [Cinara cedri]|uniref:procollagen-proline 4-dioxygenase n=1 Tax=Cinara cedri TaxID=506608 RepID=A0A5E4ND51_9HEMI|nr:Prolyl 4-hydroxylase, alpha subunit,Oxoglutarate/iron-dependent dioxygenase,Prolyl 4- [Cinara cedri]
MFKYLIFLSLLIFTEAEKHRWHTSQLVLKKLYDLQQKHFDAFRVYLNMETERLDKLKNILDESNKLRNQKCNGKNMHCLHNSNNGLEVLTQRNNRLQKIEDLTRERNLIKAFKKIGIKKKLSGDTVTLALQGLKRIQRFYEIPASEMANGRHNNRIIGDQLNVCECYVISKYCFKNKDMYGAIDWAIQAYNKWIFDDRLKCMDINKLKRYIIASSIYTGNNYVKILNSNGIHYSEHGSKLRQYNDLMRGDIKNENHSTVDIFYAYRDLESYPNEKKFKELCNLGRSTRTLTKDAKCQYQTKNSSYRLLMPFKEEHVENNLNMKIYHDVLYDNEIIKIKSLATDKLIDSGVRNIDGSYRLSENVRSSQTCWIENDQAEGHFDEIDIRIGSITGLCTQTAERYQVVNYGLGGHYIPHHDALVKGQYIPIFGNRLVTVLLYLTDIENYGQTAFPMLNIISPVEKGAALVWYNLQINNGKLNYQSLHGSCPILTGNKWIMTRWLREEGQSLPYNWKNA